MKVTLQRIGAILAFAFVSLSEATVHDQGSGIAPDRLTMLEAAAARTGATSVSYIPITWDDIPSMPFSEGLIQNRDPFRHIPFTLPEIRPVSSNHAIERTPDRCSLDF